MPHECNWISKRSTGTLAAVAWVCPLGVFRHERTQWHSAVPGMHLTGICRPRGNTRCAHAGMQGETGTHARKKAAGATPRRPGCCLTQNAPCWSATSCSPTDYSAVPSALGGLTSGFGMGLNFRVRNGTGCASPAMVADQQGAFCCRGRVAVPSGPHSVTSIPSRTATLEK